MPQAARVGLLRNLLCTIYTASTCIALLTGLTTERRQADVRNVDAHMPTRDASEPKATRQVISLSVAASTQQSPSARVVHHLQQSVRTTEHFKTQATPEGRRDLDFQIPYIKLCKVDHVSPKSDQ